jgi:hypothetical protein
VLTVAHQTLSCVHCPGQGTRELATLGILWESLRYNSPDCPVDMSGEPTEHGQLRQRSTEVNSKKCTVQKSELRSQNAPDCPVLQEDKGLQRSIAPNPNGKLTWHALYNEECHVRCTNGLSDVPSTATARIVVRAINTPQPPPFKPSKFSELHIQYKSKGKHSKDTIKAFNSLQAPKSTQLLRDLREDHLCFFCCSCCLDCFLILTLNF